MEGSTAQESPVLRHILNHASLSEVDSMPSSRPNTGAAALHSETTAPSALLPHIPESNDIYRDLIVACLRKNNGNRKLTAQELGISTTTLWRKIRYYHLE